MEKEKLLVDIMVGLGTGLIVLTIAALGAWENYTDLQRDLLVVYPGLALGMYAFSFLMVESFTWRYSGS